VVPGVFLVENVQNGAQPSVYTRGRGLESMSVGMTSGMQEFSFFLESSRISLQLRGKGTAGGPERNRQGVRPVKEQ
jgi:hypothetical protein